MVASVSSRGLAFILPMSLGDGVPSNACVLGGSRKSFRRLEMARPLNRCVVDETLRAPIPSTDVRFRMSGLSSERILLRGCGKGSNMTIMCGMGTCGRLSSRRRLLFYDGASSKRGLSPSFLGGLFRTGTVGRSG